MQFIPYQKVLIKTDLLSEEVIERLTERVGPKRYQNFVRTDRNIFNGRIGYNQFDLTLNITYRNSWTPFISGTITESTDYSIITATLKSNLFVIFFTAIFMLIGATLTISQLVNMFNGEDYTLLVFLFFIAPYGLCWLGFNLDAEKAIDALLKISQGKIIK